LIEGARRGRGSARATGAGNVSRAAHGSARICSSTLTGRATSFAAASASAAGASAAVGRSTHSRLAGSGSGAPGIARASFAPTPQACTSG
jgi:hypothetical protein